MGADEDGRELPPLSPGLHRISARAYHLDPSPVSLSASVAHIVQTRTLRHAWEAHPRLCPWWKPEEPNSAMDFGSALHAMLLEDMGAGRGIVIVEAQDWRTRSAQEERRLAHQDGMPALLKWRYDEARELVNVWRTYIARSEMRGLFDVEHRTELTAVWDEGAVNRTVRCRSRLDYFAPDFAGTGPLVVDLKFTATNAAPQAYARQVVNMGYHLQAAMYLRGIAQTAEADARFVLIVCESEPPYAVSLLELSRGFLEIGRREFQAAVDKWDDAFQRYGTAPWPAYSESVVELDCPAWYENALMEREVAGLGEIKYGD